MEVERNAASWRNPFLWSGRIRYLLAAGLLILVWLILLRVDQPEMMAGNVLTRQALMFLGLLVSLAVILLAYELSLVVAAIALVYWLIKWLVGWSPEAYRFTALAGLIVVSTVILASMIDRVIRIALELRAQMQHLEKVQNTVDNIGFQIERVEDTANNAFSCADDLTGLVADMRNQTQALEKIRKAVEDIDSQMHCIEAKVDDATSQVYDMSLQMQRRNALPGSWSERE